MFDESILPNPYEYDTRAKMAALVGILIDKGIITEEEFITTATQAMQVLRETDPTLKALRELDEALTNATRKSEGPTTP